MRKPTRRRVTGILAGLLSAAVVISACGGSDNSASEPSPSRDKSDCPVDALDSLKEPVDIAVWHVQTGSPKIALDKIVAKYNASQDKVIVHAENQGTVNEQFKKFQDSMADPKSIPEIVQPDDTVTQFMADSGTAIPTSDCIAADKSSKAIYDDMLPFVKAAYSINDVLWPGAFNASGAVLFVNENHMEAAGLDPKNLPKTLAELRTTAEKIKAAGIPKVEEPLVMRIDSWPLEYLISGAKQPIVNNDNGRAGLATKSEYASKVTLEVLTWVDDMHADGLLKYTDYADEIAPFLAMAGETSSLLIDSSAAISTVDAAISGTLTPDQVGLGDDVDLSGFSFPDLRITVGDLPGLTEPGKGQMGGTAWYLLKDENPAKIAAAWDFMKFFNQPEQQVIWAVDGSAFPVTKTAIDDPGLKKAWETTQAGRWMQQAYLGFKSLDPDFPGPVIGPYKEFRQLVKNGVEDIILKDADPDATMKSIDKSFGEELKKYESEITG